MNLLINIGDDYSNENNSLFFQVMEMDGIFLSREIFEANFTECDELCVAHPNICIVLSIRNGLNRRTFSSEGPMLMFLIKCNRR